MRLPCMIVAALLVIVLPPPPSARALELVTNGDFEADLSQGWTQSTAGASASITRGTGYEPDPDYEIYVRKASGSGHARATQTVAIPAASVELSVRLQPNVQASGGGWSAAGVIVTYLDELEFYLGRTVIASRSGPCPWVSSPTTHLITPTSGVWQELRFAIDDELANLPGVDPAAVRKLGLAVVAEVGDC